MPSKKARGKETRPPKTPPSGLFGKMLHEKLRAAPPGTSDDTILMEVLRSVPVDQVKVALKKAHPKERNLLFAALPGSHIASILGSLPQRACSVGAACCVPPPAPTGGPPRPFSRRPTRTSRTACRNGPNWSRCLKGVGSHRRPRGNGCRFMTKAPKGGFAGGSMVGLTGWVVARLSQGTSGSSSFRL